MKTLCSLLLGGALWGVLGLMNSVVAADGPAAGQDNVPPAGFVALFNGKDLSGWFGLPHTDPREFAKKSPAEQAEFRTKSLVDLQKHWKVENGVIINDGHGEFLTTAKEFGDFELKIDFKVSAKADSGIYLRGTPQVQIWDYTVEEWFKLGADKGSGGLWNNTAGKPGKDPLVKADKPIGEWNSFHIQCVGSRVTVILNGQVVVNHAILENFYDRAAPLFQKGVIQLQTHGGEMQWKNIYIRELTTDEANAVLRQHSEEAGSVPVFDGSTLAGWTGAVENYEVVAGAIQCKPGHGGVLYTKDEYSDFVATLEFKLPPAGNNGLAIRFPGNSAGDAAYIGMCELQVLDSEHPNYAKIDPRQAHGSAYGMFAAHRGFLRPTGEWNFEKVTVKGSTLNVELNGYVILDCDLANVKEFMANTPHPGKDRTSGYFGFAGHSDPVAFRNIKLRPLK